uniref:Uncharacterized protein n=1 Tax=Chromera velia CCMP2878 TaxID=1169474 RepID=A0A0G4HIX6_9ALVE|eukprot:Cvel_28000.t1-p1 / transcript=Cvel_28000.t1 / gene=Cvel_28000 / organism=Chromera_velia_CCMP2878 / gene_product=hypothetical protein / transcript_product=hypothetical protein / location=Cvel_scaffold3589:3654-10428(+) / protein_length=942 / sequence_SO=supercontig / SO=protein_coding / is_pseudo=false
MKKLGGGEEDIRVSGDDDLPKLDEPESLCGSVQKQSSEEEPRETPTDAQQDTGTATPVDPSDQSGHPNPGPYDIQSGHDHEHGHEVHQDHPSDAHTHGHEHEHGHARDHEHGETAAEPPHPLTPHHHLHHKAAEPPLTDEEVISRITSFSLTESFSQVREDYFTKIADEMTRIVLFWNELPMVDENNDADKCRYWLRTILLVPSIDSKEGHGVAEDFVQLVRQIITFFAESVDITSLEQWDSPSPSLRAPEESKEEVRKKVYGILTSLNSPRDLAEHESMQESSERDELEAELAGTVRGDADGGSSDGTSTEETGRKYHDILRQGQEHNLEKYDRDVTFEKCREKNSNFEVLGSAEKSLKASLTSPMAKQLGGTHPSPTPPLEDQLDLLRERPQTADGADTKQETGPSAPTPTEPKPTVTEPTPSSTESKPTPSEPTPSSAESDIHDLLSERTPPSSHDAPKVMDSLGKLTGKESTTTSPQSDPTTGGEPTTAESTPTTPAKKPPIDQEILPDAKTSAEKETKPTGETPTPGEQPSSPSPSPTVTTPGEDVPDPKTSTKPKPATSSPTFPETPGGETQEDAELKGPDGKRDAIPEADTLSQSFSQVKKKRGLGGLKTIRDSDTNRQNLAGKPFVVDADGERVTVFLKDKPKGFKLVPRVKNTKAKEGLPQSFQENSDRTHASSFLGHTAEETPSAVAALVCSTEDRRGGTRLCRKMPNAHGGQLVGGLSLSRLLTTVAFIALSADVSRLSGSGLAQTGTRTPAVSRHFGSGPSFLSEGAQWIGGQREGGGVEDTKTGFRLSHLDYPVEEWEYADIPGKSSLQKVHSRERGTTKASLLQEEHKEEDEERDEEKEEKREEAYPGTRQLPTALPFLEEATRGSPTNALRPLRDFLLKTFCTPEREGRRGKIGKVPGIQSLTGEVTPTSSCDERLEGDISSWISMS